MLDSYFMKRAISLAQGGRGRVSPNPLVGSVIVKNNRIIGEGFHRAHGEKHAEIEALDSCRESPYGGTLYCNLEPCSKSYPGKINPPCCDAIIRAGISRVVIGQIDPNPEVAGSGVSKLKAAGIEVLTGVEARESFILNRGFNSVMTMGRPWVHLKWAQTLDGQIASLTGKSKWISSQKCREEVHSYRSLYDGILVGRKTLELDNPLLDARYGYFPSPRAVIVDPELKASPDLAIFKRNPLIICSTTVSDHKKRAYSGDFIELEGRNFSTDLILKSLKNRGINSLFVEGGASILTAFLKDGLWDRVTVYTAPKIMGAGISPVLDLGVDHPGDSITFARSSFKTLDNHMVFNGYRESLCLQE